MSSIYLRDSDKKWVASIEIPSPDGKRKRKVIYANTRKLIKQKLKDIEDKIEAGFYDKDVNISFYTLCEKWYSVKGSKLEETTKELYRIYIDVHIKPEIGSILLQDLKPMDIDSFYNKKLESQSPNTVLKYHKFIKMVLQFGVDNRYIKDNISNRTTPPKKVETKYSIYTDEDFKELFNVVKGTYDELPIALAVIGGLRRGEIFGLCWKDIDFENNTITIQKTEVRMTALHTKDPKNVYSFRTITVPSVLINIIHSHKPDIVPADAKICDMYSPSYYSTRFSKHIIKKYNLKKIRFHDLRHYNATLMLMLGIDNKTASERLGQGSDITLKKVYQHVRSDMRDSATNKLENTFKNIL